MRRDVMKCLILCLVISQMVISTAALTTNNRILLSTAVVGTALAFSVCKYIKYIFCFLIWSHIIVIQQAGWSINH